MKQNANKALGLNVCPSSHSGKLVSSKGVNGSGVFFYRGGNVKKRKVDPWFPFWIDKWLFGSTRIELEPDERGVFVDLISLSKKDSGYIRANEGVPYLENQLCGLLNITSELFQRTVKKCIKYGKTKKLKDGTLYMTSYEIYSLSDRQERRLEAEMAEKPDTMAEKPDTKKILDNKRLNKNKRDKNIKESNANKKITFNFETENWDNIKDKDIERWKETYPACDIKQELLYMADWLISNPSKKKSNYARFISNWLRKQQDQGGTKKGIKSSSFDVGKSNYKPLEEATKRQAIIEAYRAELQKKYKPKIEKAKKEKNFDRLNEIENMIQTEVARKSQKI